MAEPKAKVPGALRVTKPGVRTYERSRKASFFVCGYIIDICIKLTRNRIESFSIPYHLPFEVRHVIHR